MRGRVDNSLFHANLLDAPDHDCDFAGRVAGSERMAVRGGGERGEGKGNTEHIPKRIHQTICTQCFS